jgi:putative PIN family toxin of toxin-antitoxin system
MRAVVDTNVIISGMITPDGAPAKIVNLIVAGELVLLADDRILAEYFDVIRRDYLSRYLSDIEKNAAIDFIDAKAERIVACRIVENLPDPGDIPFIETALSAGVPFITGNKKHYPMTHCAGVEILSPQEFLSSISKDMQ